MKTSVFEDNGGHFPDMASARAYVQGVSGSNTSADYHSDRIRALRLLTSDLQSAKTILDFGCGDGMYLRELCPAATRVVGVDISAPMIELATSNLADMGFSGYVGGPGALARLDDQFDLVFAVDVLGYLESDDLDEFYRHASRLVRPGGHLIVMYGNELFDLFALNAGTAAFFAKHFSQDVADLLVEGRSVQYKPARRKNPLNFGAELAAYGFAEVRQAYSQWHKVLPALGNKDRSDLSAARMEMRDHSFDPNSLPPSDQWKALFRSSIFASKLQRTD